MKTQKIFGLMALFFFTTFLSCSSDSDGGSTTSSSLSAKIDGQTWNAITNGVVANVSNLDDEGIPKKVLQIIAAKADQSTITLQFPIDNLIEGTYTFDGEGAGMISYSNIAQFSIYNSSATEGTVTVTLTNVNLTDGTISGTFSGTVYDIMGSGASKTITNGTFQNVVFNTTGIYSNGSMSLAKNNGSVFTMSEASPTNSKILILESSLDNSVTVNGNALVLGADFGIYSVNFPKDATPGTYAITANGAYKAGYAGNEAEDFTVSSGSITIVSHEGNTVKATFNYTAIKGATTVTVSQGTLEIMLEN